MTADEQRGYSKGYAAGKRRAATEYSRELADWRREQFKQRAALVALQQMMLPGNAWGTTVDGVHKPYTSMEEYSKAAFLFADHLAKRTYFSGERFGPVSEAEKE